MADVTLYRQSAARWPGGAGVHVLDRRKGFMLISAILMTLLSRRKQVVWPPGRRSRSGTDRPHLTDRGSAVTALLRCRQPRTLTGTTA
jgi:hypothetical protein